MSAEREGAREREEERKGGRKREGGREREDTKQPMALARQPHLMWSTLIYFVVGLIAHHMKTKAVLGGANVLQHLVHPSCWTLSGPWGMWEYVMSVSWHAQLWGDRQIMWCYKLLFSSLCFKQNPNTKRSLLYIFISDSGGGAYIFCASIS